MKTKLLLIILSVNLNLSFAQKEANIWCFGENAGLDFNSGSPVAFPGVSMVQQEGCASIAGATGNLLFYTDGMTVWNSNHVPMPNGTGLSGNQSSTQSALIVKQPGNTGIYYLFTTGYGSTASFDYNIVDMSLQGGSGDVTALNVQLLPAADEKITAVRHSNGSDIWIITTQNKGDIFHSFLLTSTGISTTPVTTVSGISHFGLDFMGCLKASPLRNKLAAALQENSFELHDFDNATGITSNPVVMASPNYHWAYGVEFSPDGTRLYCSEYGSGYHVYQFDLTAGSPNAIINSATLIGTSTGHSSTLQMGPDQKIYMANYNTSYLSVINFPNLLGTACNFVDLAVNLSPGSSRMGLPNIFTDYVIASGAEEVQLQAAGFTIYPNPVSENSIVTFQPDKKSGVTIELFNASGKLVHSQHYKAEPGHNKFELITNKLQTGIFLMALKNERKIFSKKIIYDGE
ncbi:MAG TPA: T9SS type A sorting domain-containing protein [Bacteroidia bacterium]|nr:T9SS type A sorting domain-containing protein [Bacteroidia bacterium]